MTVSAAHRDVTSLCYQMLVQFRELFQSSPAEAMLRYNFDKLSAESVVSMSHEELKGMAGQGLLCFSLKLPAERILHGV